MPDSPADVEPIDPAEALADSVAAYVNEPATHNAHGFVFDFTATNPDDPQEEMAREENSIRVLLVANEEEEERTGRDGASVKVNHGLLLIVLSLVKPNRTRKQLNGFARRLRVAVRQKAKFSRGDGFKPATWVGSEVVTKFDPSEISQSDFYFHVSRLGFTSNDC